MGNGLLLTLGSILFGMIAWILPAINLAKYNEAENKNWIVRSLASMGACAVSLCMVIFYIKHLVKISDWSGLMDTVPAFSFVSTALLAVTIILNIITVLVYFSNIRK